MKSPDAEKKGRLAGQFVQAALLGFLLAVSVLRLLSVSAGQQAFRYQGF